MPRVRFHLILFAITCLTTTITGMAYSAPEQTGSGSASFFEPITWALTETANGHLYALTNGLLFTFTLLAILGAHEFGHYFACRYYGVRDLAVLSPGSSDDNVLRHFRGCD